MEDQNGDGIPNINEYNPTVQDPVDVILRLSDLPAGYSLVTDNKIIGADILEMASDSGKVLAQDFLTHGFQLNKFRPQVDELTA